MTSFHRRERARAAEALEGVRRIAVAHGAPRAPPGSKTWGPSSADLP